MIFSCNGFDFTDALNKISMALPQRKLSAILDGIKIEAQGDYVSLTATDMDFTIIKKIKADVKMSGEILVPGKLFIDFVKKLNGDFPIEIYDEEETVVIKYLDNTSKLNLLNIEEYPVIKDYDYDYSLTILQKDFKELVNKTAFASNMNDDNRPVLKGCLFKVDEDEIQSVALDGFRMAICKKHLVSEHPTTEINIPSKDLVKISKLLENDEDSVDLCFANKKLIINNNDLKIISTPIEGFVNYKASIPNTFETEITVSTRSLEAAIDRVSTFAKYEKSFLVKLEVKNNILNISSNSEYGNASENISVLTKGKDIVVGYNAKYITDCLKNIDDEYVVIKMNYSNPTIITGVEDSEYLFLILPIRFR